MNLPERILLALRAEMRAAGLTYRMLADRVDMSESSIKRIFASGDMSLTRLASFCRAAGIPIEDVLRQATEHVPEADTLTIAQERALVADLRLLLVAICCVGHWSLEQILETYRLTQAECIRCLVRLDRLGIIELKPLNRYRMKVSRTFRWLPDGPVQHFFRAHIVNDYFAGRFDGTGETLLFVHGRLSQPSAVELVHKIQQLAGELAHLHQLDQRLPPDDRDGYTLMLGLRSWEFAAFTSMRHDAVGP